MEAHYYIEYNRMERQHWWFQGRRQVLGAVLSRLPGIHGRPRILDLGCGPGESVRHLSQWGKVIAIDVNDLAMTFCRRKALRRIARADAVRLPFADNSFDLVCGLDILEHLADEAGALGEIRRVCKPGGHVLLTVPALPILWSEHDVVNHHQRRYRRPQLRNALNRAGLGTEYLSYFNTLLFPPTLAVRLAGRLLNRQKDQAAARSDLACTTGGLFGPLLRKIFAIESHLVGRVNLPIGVSLICVARKPLDTHAVLAGSPAVATTGRLPPNAHDNRSSSQRMSTSLR